MTIYSINPATEEVLAEFNEFTPEQIDMALREARQAFEHWRTTSFEERAEPVRRAATYLRQHKPRLARLITEEMGKPITEAEAEIEKCAWNCEFYAQHASRFLADEPVATNARESFVAFEPLGVVLAIMPWNFPFWQVFRFAAPALMAGNAAVLKHASNVPQCALAIEEVFRAAGFPQGVFRTLLVPAQAVEGIIKHRHVAAVTLTGSETVGSMVARTAGEALKKTVLELGGSDPFIVLADADLDKAVEFAVRSRFQNTGQSCIAAKRFIVVEKIADTFEHRFAEAAGRLRVGDPMKRETQVGPMARGDLRTGLDQQVRDSVQQGAQ
ncbi:MAG: aldehyde dehydrogenase family protein, partial [Ktedonobacteraceae bacterium]|nr:aldehyde dehydrogenase family protein [Ktedonobacteraceae bacterium]